VPSNNILFKSTIQGKPLKSLMKEKDNKETARQVKLTKEVTNDMNQEGTAKAI
jgi:hypothetical protein